MLESAFDLSSKKVMPFTLIYLKSGARVLLLKRSREKEMQAGEWLGLGGKVEPGEDRVSSAIREFAEESGLTIKNPTLRGTFSWIGETTAGTLYLFVATEYAGNLLEETDEGVLGWHNISDLDELEGFAEHQKLFLPKILRDDDYFYCGMALFDAENMIQYADSAQYFLDRNLKIG